MTKAEAIQAMKQVVHLLRTYPASRPASDEVIAIVSDLVAEHIKLHEKNEKDHEDLQSRIESRSQRPDQTTRPPDR